MKINYESINSESDVEVKILLPILEEIGYKKEDINLRVPVTVYEGRKKLNKIADIYAKSSILPNIVIEAKNIIEKIDDKQIFQLDSYAFVLECKFGIISNGKEIILRKYLESNKKINLFRLNLENFDTNDILSYLNENNVEQINQANSKSADSFANTLKSIHSTIRNIDKLDPTGAFDGWSKLLFMKIHEEKWSLEHGGKVRFNYQKFLENKDINKHESYIQDTFLETKKAYPQVFESENEQIGLSITAIEKILELLDGYNIMEIPYDIKGKAFEIFLSSTFRGKGLGQFFTPREIVNFMVSFIGLKIGDVVLDPACGTGGFLISSYNHIMNLVNNTPNSYWESINTTKQDFMLYSKKHCFLGIDAEPRAAKTAKMNMIMWGDGENVFRGNGLDEKDLKGNNYPFNNEHIDIILANPPFGNKEENKDILSKYNLSNHTTKTECLFIEKAINLLKPNGKLGIVLPDAILGSESMAPVRKLILRNSKINAIISLPNYAFAPSGVQTINTSLVFLEKYDSKTIEKLSTFSDVQLNSFLKEHNYNIFMAVANNIGYESTGKTNKLNDLDDILQIYNTFFKNISLVDKITSIDNNIIILPVENISVGDRIDSRYYWFQEQLKLRTFERRPLKNYIFKSSTDINPKENLGEEFSILSVTNKYGIILDEDDPKKHLVPAENFNQKYKVVSERDIVFNPYRINVGSIGLVEKEYEGLLVSPAYVVFKTKNNLDSKVLLTLLKHPFYQLYIDILATGSVRNSFSYKYLEKLEIPTSIINGQIKNLTDKYDQIDKLNKEIIEIKESTNKEIDKYLT